MSSAVVFVLFVIYERPGLGIGHFLYISIALAAMAGGHYLGALAGTVATALYVSGVLLNPRMPSHEILTAGTFTRLATYVSISALIGWFASRNRTMMSELRVLAERDLTGLPNTRAFGLRYPPARIRDSFPCSLADMDLLGEFNRDEGFAAGNEALRKLAENLAGAVSPSDDVARVKVTSSPC